jgi:hypothetical protein
MTNQQRTEIQTMLARFDAAIAAGQTIDSRVQPVVNGARAALTTTTDAAFLARCKTLTAKEICLMAAHGDIQGNFRLI